ncbi:MAG: hypothetical protein M1337_08900 [Actinobacteria bacterium]|nr:hypothetical protein [Actinomycetota bacterium]
MSAVIATPAALAGPNVRVECPNCGPTIWRVRGKDEAGKLVGWQGECQGCHTTVTLPPRSVHPSVIRPR